MRILIAVLFSMSVLTALADNSGKPANSSGDTGIWLKSGMPVELKALDSANENSSHGSYTGALSPAAQSRMGIEFRVPFGTGSDTILRSEDMKKQE